MLKKSNKSIYSILPQPWLGEYLVHSPTTRGARGRLLYRVLLVWTPVIVSVVVIVVVITAASIATPTPSTDTTGTTRSTALVCMADITMVTAVMVMVSRCLLVARGYDRNIKLLWMVSMLEKTCS